MKIPRIFAALLAGTAFTCLADEPPKCRLVRIAEWHVRLDRGQPVIEGAINGKKVGVLLDTGAFASMVTKAAAEKLELPLHTTGRYAVGFGGESRIYSTNIQELRVGDTVVSKSLRGIQVIGEHPLQGVDFIVGNDVFKGADMEFDYAKGVVRLFQSQDCGNKALAYWDPEAVQLPMEDSNAIVMPIRINGREARAELDSGAYQSVVHLTLAAKLGITPDSPGVVSSGCSSGIGAGLVREWVAKFDTVELGREVIRDPRLKIADFMPELTYAQYAPADVMLGTDFLRSHRVLVSRKQQRVYFTYEGGQVFPAAPAFDCDERMAGKSTKEALAAYDEAIAKNPKDVKALLARSRARRYDKDMQGALSDLDAAIALEPQNAAARAARGSVRAGLKDYDGALADYDVAVANGMRNADAYAYRATLQRSRGDRKASLAELDEALDLDAHNQRALRLRARLRYEAGLFEAADSDFVRLLAIRPDSYDSIWLALSRQLRGIDGGAALEQAAAQVKGDEWPAPIVRHLQGRIDQEALLAAANSDVKERKARVCQARFYGAQRLLVERHKAEARQMLVAARDDCPKDLAEYDTVVAELAE